MDITKISNSKIQKIDFVTLKNLPTSYLIITLSEGLSLELAGENTIHIRDKKGIREDDNKKTS